MKFNEYRLLKDMYPSYIMDGYDASHVKTAEFYDPEFLFSLCEKLGNIDDPAGRLTLLAEVEFYLSRRPFYNIYPAVTRCLRNTSLDIGLEHLLGECEGDLAVALCFAEGSEPRVKGGVVPYILSYCDVGVSPDDTGPGRLNLVVCRVMADAQAPRLSIFTLPSSGDWPTLEKATRALDLEEEEVTLVRIAVGVLLLAKDERFAEPILLQKDQERKFDADGLKRAVERAKNRGRNGMTIGKHLEVSPHMRRPHFAIRWTGEGAKIPKLVPVKASIVSRSKLYPIPTGYMNDAPTQTAST